MRNALRTPSTLALSGLAVVCLSGPAQAQAPAETSSRPMLEEIIVTAQKTRQSMHDVPISMSAITGDTLKELGIVDMQNVALYTPNAKVTEDYRAIRGVGSTVDNQGSEDSVSFYVDGIFQKGDVIMSAAFLDIDRVEVLRGPQGTLYGKNAIAGVLAIRTKDPSDEFSAFFDIAEGSDNDLSRVRGGIGGEVIDSVMNARLAFVYEDKRGHLENTAHNEFPENIEYAQGAEKQTVRLKLGFPDVFGWDLVMSHTTVENEGGGTGWQMFRGSEGLEREFQSYDPEFRFGESYDVSIDADERAHVDANQTYLRAVYGESWQLSVTGGFNYQDVRGGLDADFSPAPVVWAYAEPIESSVVQWEVQLSSPELDGLFGIKDVFGLNLGRSEFIIGTMLYRNWTLAETDIFLDGPVYLSVLGESSAGDAIPLFGEFNASDLIGLLPLEQEQVFRSVRTRTQAKSIFGQYTWHPTEQLHILLGARVGNEKRHANWRLEFVGSPPLLFPVIGWAEYQRELDFEDNEFSPKFSTVYDISDDINVYFTAAKGFKSGGINDGSTNGAEGTLFYEPEEATSYEIGSKMYLFERAMELNMAVFYSEYDNLQTSFVNDAAAFVVANAAEATLKGAEVDFNWLASEWLNFRGGIGYVHGRYDSYPNAPCQADQEATQCDLAGKPIYRLTPWTGSLTGNILLPVPIFDNLGGLISITANYQHDTLLNADNDPDEFQEAYIRWDARLGIGEQNQQWSLTLVSQNVTNEKYKTGASDAGLFDVGWGVIAPPRATYLEFRYNY